jgi:hypothetical protein
MVEDVDYGAVATITMQGGVQTPSLTVDGGKASSLNPQRLLMCMRAAHAQTYSLRSTVARLVWNSRGT